MSDTDARTAIQTSASNAFAKSIEGALYIFGTIAGVRLADIPKQQLWVHFLIAMSILLRFSIGARNHLSIEYADAKDKPYPSVQMLLDVGFLMVFAGLLAIATSHLLSPFAGQSATPDAAHLLRPSQEFLGFLIEIPLCAVLWSCVNVLIAQPSGSCNARILPAVALCGNALLCAMLFHNIRTPAPFAVNPVSWPVLGVSCLLNVALFTVIERSDDGKAKRWSQWILIDTVTVGVFYAVGMMAQGSLLETEWKFAICATAFVTMVWDLLYIFDVVKKLAAA